APPSTFFPYTTLFRSHRCGGPGEDGPRECGGFMDDGALECLRRKMMTGRHQPSDKLEQDSQGPIFNLCKADTHALRRLERSAHRSEEHTSELQSPDHL